MPQFSIPSDAFASGCSGVRPSGESGCAGSFSKQEAFQTWHAVFNFWARSAGVLPQWTTKKQAGLENRPDV
jgi:hypothetical protein